MNRCIKNLLGVLVLLFLDFAVDCMTTEVYRPIWEEEFSIRGIKIHQRHFDRINSTQMWSYDNVQLRPAEGAVWELVSADVQTAGVGSHNRKWISHITGNVYATLSFPTEIVSGKLPPVPQLSALAVYNVVEQLSAIAVHKTVEGILGIGKRIQIKWPNDVIVDSKKISGSLACVSNMQNGRGICSLGVGINVNMPQDILDTITEQKVTSLSVVTGKKYDEKEVLLCYIDNFIKIIEAYKAHPYGFFDDFYESMAFRGEVIRVHDDSKHPDKEKPCTTDCYVEGVMEGVTEDGLLKLRTSAGNTEYICNGTVVKK